MLCPTPTKVGVYSAASALAGNGCRLSPAKRSKSEIGDSCSSPRFGGRGAEPKTVLRRYSSVETRMVTPPVAKFGTSSTIFFHSGVAVTFWNCFMFDHQSSVTR